MNVILIHPYINLIVRKMGPMCIVILWLCILFTKKNAKCSEAEVFAIPGCNATMEWILGRTYMQSYVYSIKVFNATGIEIAQMESMECKHVKDSSIYCEVRNTSSNKWRFAVVLFNVSQASSGKYNGEIQYGRRNQTITKELKIIDRPQIKVTQKPILHEPFSITCTVSDEFERLIYHWKLNGEDLYSTERIDARSANLTFKRLMMVDKLSNLSCRVCSESNCCIESETYAPDPYHLSTVASSLGDNKATTEVPSLYGDNEGQRQELYWMGPSLASVFLLIIGFLILVTLRRINASSQSGQSGTEESRENLEMHNRPLTIPAVPDHSSRPYRKRFNSDNSLNKKRSSDENNCPWTCSVRQSVSGSRLAKMFARAKGDNKAATNDDNDQALNSSQRENFVSGLQEDLYNTIDEAAVSVYNYIQDNLIEETSHETGRSTEHRYYDYAISIELYQDQMASVNETDQDYLAPISDLVRPIEICQNDEPNAHVAGGKNLHVTNENYITPISDFPSPIKICQAEDTELYGKDPNYITPINDLADLHGTDPNYITPINDIADPIEIFPVVELDAHDRGKRRARSI